MSDAADRAQVLPTMRRACGPAAASPARWQPDHGPCERRTLGPAHCAGSATRLAAHLAGLLARGSGLSPGCVVRFAAVPFQQPWPRVRLHLTPQVA